MPIRFHCQYCSQLLGIARRKAGSMVNCPNCKNQVEVPSTDEIPAHTEHVSAPPPPPPVQEPAGLFDRDDFDDLLRSPLEGRGRGSMVYPSRSASSAAVPPPLEQGGWQAGLAPAQVKQVTGLVLSPARATVLTVVVILLLAIAFALGLLVGRFLL